MQWYEVQISPEMYYPISTDAEIWNASIEAISGGDADQDQDGNPCEGIHFIGDDVFIVTCADRPIQALLRAIGLLNPNRRRAKEDIPCLPM